MVPLDGYIIVRNLRLTLPLGLDAWGRPGKPQPVVISVRLRHKNIFPAAANDDCSKTTSYSDLCKAVIAAHSKERDGPAGNAIDLAHLSLLSRLDHFNGTGMTLETLCPKGTLRNEGGYGLRSTMHVGQEPSPSNSQVVTAEQVDLFTDLKLACIIGVNAHEREQKQTVVVNLELWRDLKDAAITSTGGTHHSMQTTDLYAARQKLMAEVIEAIEKSTFETVESLALLLAEHVRRAKHWKTANVQVEKPSAVALADGCGVELHLDCST